MIKQRPELTTFFCAIDGIPKGKVTENDIDMGGTWTKPEQQAVRSDVLAILQLPNPEFGEWFHSRHNAITSLLELFEMAGSVPHLAYGGEQSKETFGSAITVSRGMIEMLKDSKKHLELIARVRREDFPEIDQA